MAQTTVGLEIDGGRVTLVESVGDVAVSTRSVALDNLDDTMELVLAGYKQRRGDPPLRAVLVAPQLVSRTIDVTPAMRRRAEFESAVYTALPVARDTTCPAGLFFDATAVTGAGDTLSAGAAAVAPRDAVAQAYQALRGRRVEVVPPNFVFTGMDGLWLGLRYSVADLTLVVEGRPVQYRQLRAGGLNAVAGALADPREPESGMERLESALHRAGVRDTVAENELDRWLRLVAAEAAQTVQFWQRSGDTIPEMLSVYGTGAVAVGAESALSAVGLPVGYPEELVRAMGYLAPADRAQALSAFLAARTVGDSMPFASFANPLAQTHAAESRLRNRVAVKTIAATLLLGAVTAVSVLPTLTAFVEKAATQRHLDDLTKDFAPQAALFTKLQELTGRSTVIDANAAGDLQWSAVARTALTPPGNIAVIQFTASNGTDENGTPAVVVSVSAELDGGDYADLTAWLEQLQSTEGIRRAWSSTFTNRDGKATFQVSFEMDPSLLGEPRTAEILVKTAVPDPVQPASGSSVTEDAL